MPVLMATMPGVQHLPLSTVMAVYALPIQTNAPVVLQSTLLIAPVTIIKCVFVASRTSLAPSAVPLTLIAMVYVPIQRVPVNDNAASATRPLLQLLKAPKLTVSMPMVVLKRWVYVDFPDLEALVPVARDATTLTSGTIATAIVAHQAVAWKSSAHVHKCQS